MTKKELETGDIIVTRSGFLGVVIESYDTILFQTIGGMDLNDLEEDLTCGTMEPDSSDFDIMEVFRGNTFLDVEIGEEAPYFQRDLNWRRPCRKDRILKVIEMDKKNQSNKDLPLTMV